MPNKTVKTYACRNAILISKQITIKTILKGIISQNQWKTLLVAKDQIKTIKIFKSMCPESMLANNRIAKLKILER